MTKKLINVDEEALEAARQVLGTTTMVETVNSALREVVAARHRAEAVEEMADMYAEGLLDLDAIPTGKPGQPTAPRAQAS